MLILEPKKITKYSQDELTNSWGSAPYSLSAAWQDIDENTVVYSIRDDVFKFFREWSVNYTESLLLKRGKPEPIFSMIELDNLSDISISFDRGQDKSVRWLDNILAYLAFHDGFESPNENLRIDVTRNDGLQAYEVSNDLSNPQVIDEWFKNGLAWHNYLIHDVYPDNDSLVNDLYEFQLFLRLLGYETGCKVFFDGEADEDYRIRFPVGDKGGLIRVVQDKSGEENKVKISVERPDKKVMQFPSQPKVSDIIRLFYDEVVEWNRQAGVLDEKAFQRFYQRKKDLVKLCRQDWDSGLPKYSADVVTLNRS